MHQCLLVVISFCVANLYQARQYELTAYSTKPEINMNCGWMDATIYSSPSSVTFDCFTSRLMCMWLYLFADSLMVTCAGRRLMLQHCYPQHNSAMHWSLLATMSVTGGGRNGTAPHLCISHTVKRNNASLIPKCLRDSDVWCTLTNVQFLQPFSLDSRAQTGQTAPFCIYGPNREGHLMSRTQYYNAKIMKYG